MIGGLTDGMSLEIRAVIHFLWLKNAPNQAILSELEHVYGTGVITLRAIEKWTAAFEGGRTELADLPRSGRPRDLGKIDAVRALIEGEGYLSQKKIAQILSMHHETVKSILREDLNMRKVNFKWLPHMLNASQKASRVEVSRELLDFLESRPDRSLCKVYTGDETWVYFDNPRVSMWIGADVARPTRVRRTVASTKRMFWVDFSRTGIGAVVMLPAGQSFNKDFFTGTVLPAIVEDRAQNRPKMKANGTFLHLDNARPHLTSAQYAELGIKRLPHPPYSPDLAPCDFWLFGHLKQCLEGRVFEDDMALRAAVTEILMSIEPEVFAKVFDEWKCRLQRCIDQGGEYL
jgi:histone-lysine N-methyltransferase SETMAR